jgi:hypothetical protein
MFGEMTAVDTRSWIRSRPELAVLVAFLIVYGSWLALGWIPGSAQKLQILFLAPIDALVKPALMTVILPLRISPARSS